MNVPPQRHELRICCYDTELWDRFLYWLSDSDHYFSDDCNLGGTLPDEEYATFTFDSVRKRMQIDKRKHKWAN